MSTIANRLLPWYRQHRRRLPWRGHPDPYAVWVSEVMLQQTRVETVIPYFERWMERFPDISSLAQASEKALLNAWEGLGYYRRAHNLQHAARMVIEQYGGKLPRDVAALRKLPGIGRYTAGAIASIALGLDEATLDGNMRRVLARLFDVNQVADSTAGERLLWTLAVEHLPPGQAGDYNQALMDLGAMICLPQNPRCPECPLSEICQARSKGVQDQRPVLKPRRDIPHRLRVAAVIVQGRRVLLSRRPSQGLLGGMWEFPSGQVEGDPLAGLVPALEEGYDLRVRVETPLGVVRHAYTHFRVTERVYRCELISLPKRTDLKWVRILQLEEYPMGKIDRQIAGWLGEK